MTVPSEVVMVGGALIAVVAMCLRLLRSCGTVTSGDLSADSWRRRQSRRIVRVRRERSHVDGHPRVQRERFEDRIQLRFVVGSVKADRPPAPVLGLWAPD